MGGQTITGSANAFGVAGSTYTSSGNPGWTGGISTPGYGASATAGTTIIIPFFNLGGN